MRRLVSSAASASKLLSSASQSSSAWRSASAGAMPCSQSQPSCGRPRRSDRSAIAPRAGIAPKAGIPPRAGDGSSRRRSAMARRSSSSAEMSSGAIRSLRRFGPNSRRSSPGRAGSRRSAVSNRCRASRVPRRCARTRPAISATFVICAGSSTSSAPTAAEVSGFSKSIQAKRRLMSFITSLTILEPAFGRQSAGPVLRPALIRRARVARSS